jgi:hypothetical protein
VVGNPARIAGWMCECGVKLAPGREAPASVACAACGAVFEPAGGGMRGIARGRP